MSSGQGRHEQRPSTADAGQPFKTRPLSSQCPAILKHHISPSNQTGFSDLLSPKMTIDRPKTAVSNKKITFPSQLGNRNLPSASTYRPNSAPYSSFVNFDFINAISKDKFPGKFEDKSGIQPLKRIKTEQFHTVIYKVKEQKEMLEAKIAQLESWQKEINSVDVWNTPQSAIIDSILKLSAENNPEGSANDFLRKERERQKEEKLRKKALRPGSGMNRISIARAKSVEDFFKGDEIGIGTIHQIIASPMNRMIKLDYMTQKSEISEKINQFYESAEHYRTIIEQSKDLIQTRQTTRKEMTQTDGSVSIPTENKSYSTAKAVRHTTEEGYKTFPVIDTNPDYKVNMDGINPGTRSTKATLHSPSGVVVIHSRPSTAKKVAQASTPNLMNSQLFEMSKDKVAVTENDIVNPIYLQGSKVMIKQYKDSHEKKRSSKPETPKDLSMNAMAEKLALLKNDTGNSMFLPTQKARPMTAQTKRYEVRPMSGRDSGSKHRERMQSAKTTIATQTFEGPGGTKVRKIDIDGEYFDTYTGQEGEKGGKNVLKSWVGNTPQVNLRSEGSDTVIRTEDM